MIQTPRACIEGIGWARGNGQQDLRTLVREAVSNLASSHDLTQVGAVIAATFSNPERFPSLAVRVATELGLPAETPAFDLQMACSAYPYAVYLATRLSADTGRRVLVVDGDVQSPLVNASDPATGAIFSDVVTASLISSSNEGVSIWKFLSHADEALICSAKGPLVMDGMKVFTFVATEVRQLLLSFLSETAGAVPKIDSFVPHQANPYMIRQLAKALNLSDRLVMLDATEKNPGSCSIPLTLAQRGVKGWTLMAGFGAGYSAALGLVEVR